MAHCRIRAIAAPAIAATATKTCVPIVRSFQLKSAQALSSSHWSNLFIWITPCYAPAIGADG